MKKDRPLPGSFTSGWLVARLFFRVSLGRKRIIWLALAMLIPVAMAIYWRAAEGGHGMAYFTGMTIDLFLQFFALGLPLYLGVSAIRDEIEDKTIVYLFARPLHRAVVLGGKIFSVALVVSFALALVLAVVYGIVVSVDGVAELGRHLPHLLLHMGVLAVAAVAYTALFSVFGVLLRRPMILAILIGFGWEAVVSNLPGAFPKLTLMYYLRSMLGLGPEASGMMSLLIPALDPAPFTTAFTVLAVATVLLFTAALTIGSRKEYRV
jgi:ABC-type transport system involved in multi-copper enzyme maturation permease subunit